MAGGVCSHSGIFKKNGVEDSVCRLCRNRRRTNLAEASTSPPQPNPVLLLVRVWRPATASSLREMKACNAAGQLDSKAMNDVLLDFMIYD